MGLHHEGCLAYGMALCSPGTPAAMPQPAGQAATALLLELGLVPQLVLAACLKST